MIHVTGIALSEMTQLQPVRGQPALILLHQNQISLLPFPVPHISNIYGQSGNGD